MRRRFLTALVCILASSGCLGGTLTGFVRDQNWYARPDSTRPYGVGYYECGINGNATNSASLGLYTSTDVFGAFSGPAAGGSYTVVSWDVWWRSAYAFNVIVPASGSSSPVDLRLKATMWGYPAFWDDTGYTEFGQTFEATGPISMIYFRRPGNFSDIIELTVHEGGPDGSQIGATRRLSGSGDHRPIYGYGQMPTVRGRTYYARLRSVSGAPVVIMQMDPRPDFSDPMPGGCLWLGSGTSRRAYLDRDLGLVIMADDDGIVTDLFTRTDGAKIDAARSIGQSFIARGVSLISAAVWLADGSLPVYQARVFRDGPGGEMVGTVKSGRPSRVGADPEMIVAWAPGECPLIPGDRYYLQVTRQDGALIYAAYANRSNPFAYGEAFKDGQALAGWDLAGTLMEEESIGSALKREIRFSSAPTIADSERTTNSLIIRWRTDVAAVGAVRFAEETPPYTGEVEETIAGTSHVVKLIGLRPNALYHYQVVSKQDGFRPAVSRDLVICTKPVTNLLSNPGFEQGTATAPTRPVVGWTATGFDIREANGHWLGEIPPKSGSWMLEGALNGTESEGYAHQRVPVQIGREYTFSAWVTTWQQENNKYKYDEWDERGRLIYMQLGIDPTGGIDPNSRNVEWTPRMYSHRTWSNLARTAKARASYATIYVRMKGTGGGFHLYGLDECVFAEKSILSPVLERVELKETGEFGFWLVGDKGRTNSIESSPDLVGWQEWTNVFNATGEVYLEASRAGEGTNAGGRFFRARTW